MTDYTEQKPAQKLVAHLMAKPAGPDCNLNCGYCFYLEKEALFPEGGRYRMSDEVLETYIRKTAEYQTVPELLYAWQGGEPTLMGIDFFRKAVELEKRYAGGRRIANTLQTNGILIDDEWCRFLAENKFLVGLSLDGPKDVHDRYRKDRGGEPTFDRVMRAMDLLKKHGVEFNILACVTRESAKRPLDVYRFFKEQGVRFIQLIPIVERMPDTESERLGLKLGMPASIDNSDEPNVTPWTMIPEDYGDFLIGVFDEWVKNDIGSVFIMNFEWFVVNWMGMLQANCFFSERCGQAVIVEHNGDVYSCDHFVYPKYRLGNILAGEPGEMIDSEKQLRFGAVKEESLPKYCRECDFLFACRGECPKHRFLKTPDGEPGLNYLCTGYKKFFNHVRPYMDAIVQTIRMGCPAEKVMDLVRKGKI
ncbi:MAG: anaerobic sulfatase maturase [Candidatus Tritonobacter lacicola]|nr:anaerobic sulfatase maturase [Candidatus Tritonobacter lacicola]